MLISTAHNQAAIQNINLASWIEGMSSNMAKNKLIPKIRKPGVAIFGCCLHVFPTPKMADADFILPHAPLHTNLDYLFFFQVKIYSKMPKFTLF